MSSKSKSSKSKRSFTVSDARHVDSCKTKYLVKGEAGRFKNHNPAAAAKKAFSGLCKVKKIKGACALLVKIRETTQNSKKKEFAYKCSRKKLPEPVTLNGRTYEFETRIKSVKRMPEKCKKSRKSPGPMKSKRKKTRKVKK